MSGLLHSWLVDHNIPVAERLPEELRVLKDKE